MGKEKLASNQIAMGEYEQSGIKNEQCIKTLTVQIKQVRETLSKKENALKELRSEYDKSIHKVSKLESALNEIRSIHSKTKQEMKIEHEALRQKYDDKCET